MKTFEVERVIAQVTIDFGKTCKPSLRKPIDSSCVPAALRTSESSKNPS